MAQARESVFAQVEPNGTSEMKEEYSTRSQKSQRSEVKQHLSQTSIARSTEELTARYSVSNDPNLLTTTAKSREPVLSTVTATKTIPTSQIKDPLNKT